MKKNMKRSTRCFRMRLGGGGGGMCVSGRKWGMCVSVHKALFDIYVLYVRILCRDSCFTADVKAVLAINTRGHYAFYTRDVDL